MAGKPDPKSGTTTRRRRPAKPKDTTPATSAATSSKQEGVERRAARDVTIAALHGEGRTHAEIAEAVGLSTARTSQLLAKLGLTSAAVPRGTANADRDADICRRSVAGESIDDLSKSSGLSVPRLRQILSAGGATKGRGSKSPEHDQSPEAKALRAAIAAVEACGVSLWTATSWARADRK